MSSSKEDAKKEVQKLIEKYNLVCEAREINKYNEENTKKDFILPLFEALGWKVYDRNEVTAEDKVSRKRVDYAFRINGIPKFLLEAKAIKVDLDEPKWAEQAINYSYHKGVVWVVLCDFEGIKVFNSERKTLDIFITQFLDLRYDQYIEEFDRLWLLSRDSFELKIIDTEAEKWGKKLKKIPIKDSINEQLLTDLMEFRNVLSKDIVKFNRDKILSEEDVDEAVQRILNRIIFIRKCEDNEIEPRKLESEYRIWADNKKNKLYTHLVKKIFKYFDEEYDSELFEFSLCDQLRISDETLEKVILGIYRTNDKTIYYDFSAIDADVLGSIYEQYLAYILKKTSKRAKVEKESLHRKEKGIYYTPVFVVDYIIENTIGELLKNKKTDVNNIKILDLTCGSGSFLIKAFDILNKYWLMKDIKYTQTELDFETGLPFTKKVKILKNNIFGVDLDPKAVEIAQLNLLLKIVEKKHRLPLLHENIKCGNSLIDEEKIAGYKAFKWEKEFKDILNDDDIGKFDVIVGNPPYVHQKGSKDTPMISYEEREYYRNNYKTVFFKGGKTRGGVKLNTFIPYVEKSIKLLKNKSKMGFIIHKNILKVESYKFLRRYVLENCAIEKIVDLKSQAFEEITGETVIIILRKECDDNVRNENIINVIYDIVDKSSLITGNYRTVKVKQSNFWETTDNMFAIYMNSSVVKIKNKIQKNSCNLGEIVNIVSFGLNTINNKKYFTENKINNNCKKAVMGRDVERWVIKNPDKYVYYDKSVLSRMGDEKAFLSKEKLIMQRIGSGLMCSYDEEQYYCFNSTNMILPKSDKFNLKYILTILNSELIDTYYKIIFGLNANLTVNVTQGYLFQIPIKNISTDKQKIFIEFADKMIFLNKQLIKLRSKETSEKKRLVHDIVYTENEINNLVYRLYGISNNEKIKFKNMLK